MKKCPNCNKELNDNAKFCDECGTKIETGVQPEVVESINQEPAADAETNENPKKKGHKIATIVAVIVVLAVIAAIGTTVVFKVLPTINQNKLVKQDHFFYFKDNNIFYVDLEQELTEPVQVSSKLIDEELEPSDTANSTAMLRDKAYLSSDGKYIFYPEHLRKNEDLSRISNEYVEGDTFDLYYKCIKGTKDEVSKEPEKIASDVIGYKVNTDTTCVTYLKSTDGELYQYDFIESNKLASDVKDFYLNADTQRLVYTTNDGGIYEKELETETSKIDSDVSEISYLSADLSIIYYLKEDVLYKKEVGAEKIKLAEDVLEVKNVCNNGSVYYLKEGTQNIKATEYFDDDMKAADDALTEPVEPQEPEFPTKDYVDVWLYDDYYSYFEALDAANEKYDKDLDNYNTAMDKYYDDLNKYYDDVEIYNDKTDRDAFRTKLADCSFDVTYYSLYYNNGKDETLISDNYNSLVCTSSNDTLVFSQYNDDNISKVKMSEIENDHSFLIYFNDDEDDSITDWMKILITNNLTAASDFYLAVADTATLINDNAAYLTSFKINEAGDEVIFVDNVDDENKQGDLYKIHITDGIPAEPELYDSEVSIWGVKDFVAGNKVTYFKNIKSGTGMGDLYIDKNNIGYDIGVYSLKYDKDTNSLLYIADWDNEKELGKLKSYPFNPAEGSESTATDIADDVHSYYTSKNDEILYLKDYSTKQDKGTLYLYKNAESIKIGDDVVDILSCYSDEDNTNYKKIEVYVEPTTELTTQAEE